MGPQRWRHGSYRYIGCYGFETPRLSGMMIGFWNLFSSPCGFFGALCTGCSVHFFFFLFRYGYFNAG
jgi:hypothetical protein